MSKRVCQSIQKSRVCENLEFGKRKSWLEQQELHKEFAEFQIDHWRQRCRTLREAVDRHATKFQFCIYETPTTITARRTNC